MAPAGGKVKPLDLLKAALAERQAKAQKTITDTGQKWIRRGIVEAQRREEYLEEQRLEHEKQLAEEEARLQKFEKHVAERKSKIDILNQEGLDDAGLLADALLDDDDATPPLALSEVVDRLRELGHPITIFGETDMQRYRRMRLLEKEIDEGRQNPDVLMLEQVNETQRLSIQNSNQDGRDGDGDQDDDDDEDDKVAGRGDGNGEGDDKSDSEDEGDAVADDKSDSEDEGEGGKAGDDKSDSEDEGGNASKMEVAANDDGVAMKDKASKEDLPEVEVNTELMDKCDFIRAWCRKALKAWEKELADLPDEVKKTSQVRTQVAAHRQVRRDVRPLQRRLKLYVMDKWLLDKIHPIVALAEEREYRSAAEAYLDLSIGKAAWPVGLGCGGSMLMEDAIGLHDRFNRMSQVKDIAFALNDDVTRKFVQALKRLMNVCQRHWPPLDPSKASG